MSKRKNIDDIGEFGKLNASLLAANGGSLGLSSIFLGIAETAQKIAVTSLRNQNQVQHTDRHQAQYPMNQIIAAENEIDLAASCGILGRASQAYDELYLTDSVSTPVPNVTENEAFQLLKSTASAKKFVTDRAIGIVDRALTLSGGAGFLNTHTLARLYRDVRAGPFMKAWASSQAIELIGKVTLGIDLNQG